MLDAIAIRYLSFGVLAALAAWIVAWLVHTYRRFNFTPAQFPLYMLNLIYTRIVWRATVEGRVTRTAGQGAVVVCNHVGPIDPAFVALACDRPVHWMVAKEYFAYPVFSWALKALRAIPVSRAGIDTAATRLAVRYASQGDLVGMFPEGRINTTGQVLRAGRPGAALVALKARVPVVPCYLEGSPNDGTAYGFLLMPAKARLKVGAPIDLSEYYDHESDKELLEQLTKRFMIEMARLAGIEGYQPEMAGRRWKPGMEEVA